MIKVDSFTELVVIEIVGGKVMIVYGGEYVTHSDTVHQSREQVNFVLIDYDDPVNAWFTFKDIVHATTGETLEHYQFTCQGDRKEQELEPETEWEFQHSQDQ